MNVSEFITFRVFGFARHLHYRGIRIRRNPDAMFPLEVPDSSFRIHDETGKFLFQIHVMCVNGKTNPGPKRSGFVTNPETFALV